MSVRRVRTIRGSDGSHNFGLPRPPLALQAVEHLIQRVATWKTELFSERLKDQVREFAPGTPKLNELQRGVIKAKPRLRAEGLVPGQP